MKGGFGLKKNYFDLKIFDLGRKCKSQAQIFAESMK